ncbi:hypothetical protein [Brytella acorum]|uniref:Uncharacterized protein n=1 Tax=Brytella acorum TaxID=2959299 RepID=A0AA35XY64_9PROT|nr:hypothetical protein [Brytella acorum]MDF3625055.1 hypothetical protein [Brytella acorum]CAI9121067.1 hypothetical protein LMG32879_001912 [Brytella acorum]
MATASDPLPPENTDAGALVRLLLLETIGPLESSYNRDESLKAMRLMRQVVENRLRTPARYMAAGATSEQDIVRLGNQFAGFRDYPTLPGLLAGKLAKLVSESARYPAVATFIRDAIEVVSAPTSGAASTTVAAWRTTGRGAPGRNFRLIGNYQGNSFYEVVPVPPLKTTHRKATGHFRPHKAH